MYITKDTKFRFSFALQDLLPMENIDIGENRSERMIAVVIINKEGFKTLSGVIAPVRNIASISSQ